LGVPDEDCSRNVSYVPNLIYTFFLFSIVWNYLLFEDNILQYDLR
jgi:hypothetical protein